MREASKAPTQGLIHSRHSMKALPDQVTWDPTIFHTDILSPRSAPHPQLVKMLNIFAFDRRYLVLRCQLHSCHFQTSRDLALQKILTRNKEASQGPADAPNPGPLGLQCGRHHSRHFTCRLCKGGYYHPLGFSWGCWGSERMLRMLRLQEDAEVQRGCRGSERMMRMLRPKELK